MPVIIAIDGPAGAGKSTVTRRVALALNLTYLDTGAMYRAVAWKALRESVSLEDADALAQLAQQLEIRFAPLTPDGQQQVYGDGEEVTEAIRTPAVSDATSRIAALAPVRRVVVEHQRRIAREAERGVILEGRDIGTVVFPQAELKVFLTASPEERARRRVAELQARGIPCDFAEVLAGQRERDERDSHRADSPLAAAEDAVLLPTDQLDVGDVVARIVALARERLPAL